MIVEEPEKISGQSVIWGDVKYFFFSSFQYFFLFKNL